MQSIKTETLLRHGCFTSVRAWQAEKAGREKYAHTLFTNWIFLVTFSRGDHAKIYIPSTIKVQKGAQISGQIENGLLFWKTSYKICNNLKYLFFNFQIDLECTFPKYVHDRVCGQCL